MSENISKKLYMNFGHVVNNITSPVRRCWTIVQEPVQMQVDQVFNAVREAAIERPSR